MMERIRLTDAMRGRALAARWVIRGRLTVLTALHLGGGESDEIDMRILRDARTGKPLLPGTTLAGAWRSAFADRLAGFAAKEPAEVARLFGGRRGDDGGLQSPLVIFDALGELPANLRIETRDGVAIDPKSGIAEDHKKYDFEVLPAGTTFPLRVDLLLPEGDDEAARLTGLAAALEAFSSGDAGFGARRSRGLGRVRAEWSAERYDLTTRAGWLAWIGSDHDPALPASLTSIHAALVAARGGDLPAIPDARERIVVTIRARLRHDILIRSPGLTADAPDVVHLQSAKKPVIPGTSLAGVMRAQALRIAHAVRLRQGDAEEWIDRLFGPRFVGQRAAPGFEVRASRLHVGESFLEGGNASTQTRIAIDRFTQGVVDGALFDEEPHVGGRAVIRLELRNPLPGELGLLLLVVRDLLTGRLPVGGTSSVGRGFMTGTASVAFHAGSSDVVSADLHPDREPSGPAAQEIDAAIASFAQAAPVAITIGESA
jgi:CRISPR/Cas system CSM-associated protein Csm3 (group 7 of RAMP superfamily)